MKHTIANCRGSLVFPFSPPAALSVLSYNFLHALKPLAPPLALPLPLSSIISCLAEKRETPLPFLPCFGQTYLLPHPPLLPHIQTRCLSPGLLLPHLQCKGYFSILVSFFILAALNTVDHFKFLSHFLMSIFSWLSFYACERTFGVLCFFFVLCFFCFSFDFTWASR